jgi:hypothetical protein
MEKSFKPSEEHKQYMEYARGKEETMLEKQKKSISQTVYICVIFKLRN